FRPPVAPGRLLLPQPLLFCYSHAGGVILQPPLGNMLGVPPVVLLLAHPLRSNLRRIAHPHLIVKLREQALEPTRVPGGLHPYAHADSFFLQLAVELLSLPTAVC